MASTPVDLKSLWSTINRIYGDKANHGLITKQIENFVTKFGYSYSGIEYTLMYWYDIKQKPIEFECGIKIVASVYNEARDYKYRMYMSQLVNEDKDYANLNQVKEIMIDMPEQKKYRSFRDLEVERFLEEGLDNEQVC